MINPIVIKKIAAWATLPLLPMLGTFALVWLYLTEDSVDTRDHPYSF